MSGGMTARIAHLDLPAAKLKRGASRNLPVGPGDGFARRTDDLAAEPLLERQVSFNMVAMMMSGQYMRKVPALVFELLLDHRPIGGIDARRRTRLVIVNENAIIVLPADELM